MFQPETLYGFKIKVDDSTYRVMTPSDEFRRIQSPALVKSLDRWMAEFFGTRKTMPDGQVISSPDMGIMVMNSETLRRIRIAMESRTK